MSNKRHQEDLKRIQELLAAKHTHVDIYMTSCWLAVVETQVYNKRHQEDLKRIQELQGATGEAATLRAKLKDVEAVRKSPYMLTCPVECAASCMHVLHIICTARTSSCLVAMLHSTCKYMQHRGKMTFPYGTAAPSSLSLLLLLLLLPQARDAEHLAFLQQSVACQELQRKREEAAKQLEELPRLRWGTGHLVVPPFLLGVALSLCCGRRRPGSWRSCHGSGGAICISMWFALLMPAACSSLLCFALQGGLG
jgi:hypothetical protein